MNNKLKELSRYCCKPANEQEYEFIKTCARLGGVGIHDIYGFSDEGSTIFVSEEGKLINSFIGGHTRTKLILVTQFCNILLKDESEFEFKPKVGEWCAVNWKDGDTDVFMVDGLTHQHCISSMFTRNGQKEKSDSTTSAFFDDSRATYRQPTPEEIQTAIDAWDDRVDINYNIYSKHQNIDITAKEITARYGYKFRLSEDCNTAEMVKDEVKCGFCVKHKNDKK